jgi:ubiquinone/menaquinone biosynthesis C-methylase UbiE
MEEELLKEIVGFNENKIKQLAKGVSWAKGWPKKDEAFWNVEAFIWSQKITKRDFIKQQLPKSRNNLDLGSGAYSYQTSTCLDYAEKMLQLNPNCKTKIVHDLNKPLPLKDNSFQTVTAIFLFNYLKNYHQLLKEIKRVLKPKGKFTMVLSAKKINPWYQQKEVNQLTKEEWLSILDKYFKVKLEIKNDLLFYYCLI